MEGGPAPSNWIEWRRPLDIQGLKVLGCGLQGASPGGGGGGWRGVGGSGREEYRLTNHLGLRGLPGLRTFSLKPIRVWGRGGGEWEILR